MRPLRHKHLLQGAEPDMMYHVCSNDFRIASLQFINQMIELF
jgi:hypothetical protein